MRRLLFVLFVLSGQIAVAQDPHLTVTSKDSVNGAPRLKSSLGVNIKLNGYFDVFGGLQDSDTFNVGYINVFGTDDTKSLNVDLYQTQIKFQSTYIMANGKPLTAVVESDFWGGEGHVRLRKAYVETEHWQIGQTWNNFGDEALWPNIFECEGPPSGVWVRSPHIKYSDTFGSTHWLYQFSIEAPIVDYEPYLEFEPLSEQARQTTPDVTAAVQYNTESGHVRLATIFRHVKYILDGDTDSFTGYGASLSGIFAYDKNNLQFQFTGGKGITAYMTTIGGRGYDGYAASKDRFKATPVFGGWASYEYFFTEKLHTNLVAGFTHFALNDIERVVVNDVPETERVFLKADIDHTHYYGIVNMMYNVYNRMTVGLELDYGYKRLDIDGYFNDDYVVRDKGRDAMRISFGMMFSF